MSAGVEAEGDTTGDNSHNAVDQKQTTIRAHGEYPRSSYHE